ncbi:hypothetical protein OPT61_g4350 [Boeremia exigua]|uniref:Uncharacterized protein n=1 Tax=Boeremia exigua TaxID=749465 RepID=A0ACC2IEF4_9PLEO|nr:hypothetical protein OPT61_g4350 [Boeremia exigua]
MPVYNESKFVYHAILSIVTSAYPKDRVEIIVVDDGSLDDSWEHITAAATSLRKRGLRCRLYRHKHNRGKRFALKKGFEAATGDIIVSLDSDSMLEKNTLMALITPFTRDQELGGVAGHLRVLNVKNKIIPRLLDVLFDIYGNMPRAAQSTACGAVTILPGALAAYRAVAVLPLIQSLCETTFWGKTLKHGEDIELTLGLLRSGWTTSYQRNAVVRTTAPETVRAALLTYTRWERSSLIYLFSGLIRLLCREAVHSIDLAAAYSKMQHRCMPLQNLKTPHEAPSKKPRKIGTSGSGTLFLLLNLTSTATKNLISPFLLYAQISKTTIRPWDAPKSILYILPLSGFHNLLVFEPSRSEGTGPDLQDKGKANSTNKKTLAQRYSLRGALVCQKLCGNPNPVEKAKTYFLRLQDTAIALVFHAGIVTWSTLIAIFTLRSQAWLTR